MAGTAKSHTSLLKIIAYVKKKKKGSLHLELFVLEGNSYQNKTHTKQCSFALTGHMDKDAFAFYIKYLLLPRNSNTFGFLHLPNELVLLLFH